MPPWPTWAWCAERARRATVLENTISTTTLSFAPATAGHARLKRPVARPVRAVGQPDLRTRLERLWAPLRAHLERARVDAEVRAMVELDPRVLRELQLARDAADWKA